MAYESIFDFLKDDEEFSDIYNMCISMEKAIITNSYNASLILSRTASELMIKQIVDDSVYRMDFFKKNKNGDYIHKKDGSYCFIDLSDMIDECLDLKIFGKKIHSRYDFIRKIGNSNVHGENLTEYNLKDCEKAHKNLFLIMVNGYNKLKDAALNLKYHNQLGDYDFTIDITPQERKNQINNVRFEEVSKDNLISSFKLKTIFVPINSFKSLAHNKFEDNIIDKDKFLKDIDDFKYVSLDNLQIILNYFEESVRSDITVEINELHNNISSNVFKTLDDLNKSNLTFEEIHNLIDESDNPDQKEIYTNIKTLADDLVRNYLDEYKKELESSPVTDYAENGRKLLRYKNYNINEDEYGFSLEEDVENIFLDEDQSEAVEYDGDKPLVVDAGPGSGKTRVIIERVIHLIKNGKRPESILVITFTRKATQELKERLINETELNLKDINKIRISTVHGFCRYLISKYEHVPYNYLTRHGERSLFLKKHKEELGFTKYAFLYDHWIPKVLDKYDEYFSFKVDTDRLVNCLETRMGQYETNNRRYVRYIDNFYKNNDEEYPVYKQLKRRNLGGASYYFRWLNIVKSYPDFLDLMENSSTCDDNTVFVKANEILENPLILNQLQYKNILIDEFQDTDHYQKEIFEKLLKISDTFTIVGDIDQSIYGWRGAYPEYFEEFSKKDVKNVTLHNNYRSSRNIVEFNEALIKNKRPFPKELHAKKKYKAPIYHMTNSSVDDEASRIVDLIINLKNDGKIKYYSDVAILFRQNKSVDNLIKPLEAAGIKYILKENNDFLDQTEVKAMLTLLWYVMPYNKYELNHLGDDFLNLYGFTNEKYDSSTVFRLSKETRELLSKLQENFENKVTKNAKTVYNLSVGPLINFKYDEVFDLEDDLKEKIFKDIETMDIGLLNRDELIELGISNKNDLEFFLKLNEIKSRVLNQNSSERLTTLKLYYELLNITDYFSDISLENNPDDLKIKDNLALFSHIIKDYESIMGDMDYIGLFVYLSRVLKGYSCRQNEYDEGFNKVHLLSMHSAKGLEYPVIIVGSIKQGICPLNYGNKDELYPTPNEFLEYKDSDENIAIEKYDDEELRTIYVAATRAKEILILSTVGNDSRDIPEFLYNLKLNPEINIQDLEPYNMDIIPKIESSKVFKQKNDFPRVKFEELLDDFLFCPYRYDLANNTRFKVKLRNDKYIDMIMHNLLYSIHDDDKISLGKIDAKIRTILDYHNIKDYHEAYDIINKVRDYWFEYGNKYDILDCNLNSFIQLKYCDLTCSIDLVIREDNKLSLVHFIVSDENIPDLDSYNLMMMYYFNVIKEFDEFKDYEFNKIYLHSLKNNERHEIEHDEIIETEIKEYLENFAEDIYDNRFDKDGPCDMCEYYGSVCKGN